MMKERVGWVIAIVLVAIIVGASAFYAGRATAPVEVVEVPPKPPREIIIGATLSMSGPFVGDVDPFDEMMSTFFEMINERGGLYVKEYGMRLPVKFIIYDDKSDLATSVKFYEKLITEDKADLLIGPYSSKITMGVGPVAEKYGKPIIWTEAQAPPVFAQGWKWAVGVLDPDPKSWGGNYFYYVVKPLIEEGKVKTIALVNEDIVHSVFVNKGAKMMAEEVGLEIVFEESFPTGAKDFSGLLPKLKAADADIVHFAACTPHSGTLFIKQAEEYGLKPKEFHVSEPVWGMIEPLGKDADYITGESYYAPGAYQGPLGDAGFIEELAERVGFKPEEWVWFGIHYPALQAAAAAIEMADSLKPEDLIKALKTLNVMTVSGPLSFDPETGKGSLKCVAVQVFDLKYRVISPPEVATGPHEFPTPA
ncbi:MAG: amino acid ABC transporter substrate-binding protein [Candidatus Bathyarchaeia archaeon]